MLPDGGDHLPVSVRRILPSDHGLHEHGRGQADEADRDLHPRDGPRLGGLVHGRQRGQDRGVPQRGGGDELSRGVPPRHRPRRIRRRLLLGGRLRRALGVAAGSHDRGVHIHVRPLGLPPVRRSGVLVLLRVSSAHQGRDAGLCISWIGPGFLLTPSVARPQ